jgi:threonine dehydratase
MTQVAVHPDYYRHVVRTELHRVRWEGTEVWLKDETQQVSGSFKFRGSLNVALAAPGARFVTASTGNHAAGLACAARLVGATAIVVLPRSTPDVKQGRVSAAGAEVIVHGDDYDAARQHAIGIAERSKSVYVPSFDDVRIIRGHAPLFDEARWAGAESAEFTLVPVGGGGLLASALLAAPGRVLGVELDTAAAMRSSLAAGQLVRVELPRTTRAEGLMVRQVGTLPFRLAHARGVRVLAVSEAELTAAMRWCWEHTRIQVEAAGGAAVAGLLRLLSESKKPDRPRQVLCVLTGGNISDESWRQAVGLEVPAGVGACRMSE